MLKNNPEMERIFRKHLENMYIFKNVDTDELRKFTKSLVDAVNEYSNFKNKEIKILITDIDRILTSGFEIIPNSPIHNRLKKLIENK